MNEWIIVGIVAVVIFFFGRKTAMEWVDALRGKKKEAEELLHGTGTK